MACSAVCCWASVRRAFRVSLAVAGSSMPYSSAKAARFASLAAFGVNRLMVLPVRLSACRAAASCCTAGFSLRTAGAASFWAVVSAALALSVCCTAAAWSACCRAASPGSMARASSARCAAAASAARLSVSACTGAAVSVPARASSVRLMAPSPVPTAPPRAPEAPPVRPLCSACKKVSLCSSSSAACWSPPSVASMILSA